jgi:hypothetical protein
LQEHVEDLLPAWTRIEQWLRARLPRLLDEIALPPAPPVEVAQLATAVRAPLPAMITAWFTRHAALGLDDEQFEPLADPHPLFSLARPSAILAAWRAARSRGEWPESWLPLGSAESGSMCWSLCADIAPHAGGRLFIADHDQPGASLGAADYANLDAYFAQLARRLEHGEIVAVGFDDDEHTQPRLMTRRDFDDLGAERRAHLIPRPAPPDVARLTTDEEGLRLIAMLVERGDLSLVGPDAAATLASGVGRLLRQRRSNRARASALCAWLAEQPSVDELFASDTQLVELLERW